MSLADAPTEVFNQHVEGTWGEFASAGGRVMYLMTNARLGKTGGPDWERRLTRHLRPVREVLDVRQMSFDQLLQRDLDDHRVATELVPYLLGQASETAGTSAGGPAFFPPILAVLLPGVEDSGGTLPAPSPEEVAWDASGLPFAQTRFADALRVRRLLVTPGENVESLHPIRYGTLDWSDDRARLVVIDGQHRAMALLAIERTRRNAWDDTRGARYRHFYEKRVAEALAGSTATMVQVPVTVCWFPDLVDDDVRPTQAARKLFVDVNKNARRPSEDRVILLSDDDLLNIFTQGLLNQLPRHAKGLPLFAVEYDSPVTHRGPGRWSVLTTLQSLREIIEKLVFGPPKYIETVDLEIRGRTPEDAGAYLRRQIQIEELMPSVVDDGERIIDRSTVSRKRFPSSYVPDFRNAFATTWGTSILKLFTLLAPYRAHAAALNGLYESAASTTAVEQLAREAIFEGVGMYWTLNDAAAAWNALRRQDATLERTDVVRAWELLQEHRRTFSALRATEYLDKASARDVRLADHLFQDVFKTQACQLGLALTFGTIAHFGDTRESQLPELAGALAAAVNTSLATPTESGLDMRLFLAKADAGLTPATLNSIIHMDTARAIQFRYFWLELILRPGVEDQLTDYIDRKDLQRLRDRARNRFVAYRVNEQIKSLRAAGRGMDRQLLTPQATAQVIAQVTEALAIWFDIPTTTTTRWFERLSDLTPPTDPDAEDVEDDDDHELDNVEAVPEDER